MSRGAPWGPRRDTDWDLGAPPHPIPVWPQGEGLRAATWGRPYGGKRTEGVGSAKVGAEGEPHQNQILQTQGLVARRGFRVSLRFCAPEGFCLLQGITPVMGGPGVRRIWTRSVHPEPSPGDPQGELPRRGKRGWPGPLVSFPSLGKKLAARTAPAGATR